jgi:xanthine/uracil permease
MTTSFAHLVRGDVWNSVRANAVGTLLAAFCLMLVPWNLACALRGRLYLVTSIEWILTRLVIGFLILLLGRWLIVVAMTYFTSH